MGSPGEFEQVVLLALAGIGRETTGREVYETIVDTTGRDASVASVHITLNRLHEKGWATSRSVEPPPGAGGKPRRRYALSPDGASVLAEVRATLDRLWARAEGHPLLETEE